MIQQKRLNRSVFTRKLNRICQRLDEAPIRSIPYRMMDLPRVAQVRISALWVVGSYARGASHCGDLDLIIEASAIQGSLPYPSEIARAFFGSLHYVSYFSGTPETNTSGVAFENAVCIWHGPSCNWQAAIAAIELNQEAGRAPRETDGIPFLAEQLACNIDHLQEIALQWRHGILSWEFIPFEAAAIKNLSTTPPLRERGTADWYFGRVGKKSQQILMLLAELLPKLEPAGTWSQPCLSINTEFRCGTTVILIGKPFVPVKLLDDNLSVHQLLIVPHLCARGPNGAWLIRRGENHPDFANLAGKKVYYPAEGDQNTPTIIHEMHVDGEYDDTTVLEVFSNPSDAQAMAECMSDLEEGWQVHVACAEGTDIVQLCALVEVINLDGEMLPIQTTGCRLAERDTIVGIAELGKRLDDKAVGDMMASSPV